MTDILSPIPPRTVDRRAFILNNTALQPVPHAPEIRLHLADEATELWSRTEEELGELGLPPPFWAFAWAGGQALARFILDHPDTVAGKRVLDFASGSGLVAIAACMAGAASVTAIDIDAFSAIAIGVNAAANGVDITVDHADVLGTPTVGFDVILAGDVFYEKPMADRVLPWLSAAERLGTLCLVGDPGRAYLPKDRLDLCATYSVPTTRELEDSEVKMTNVWRLKAAAGSPDLTPPGKAAA
ncbi:MAG: nicotinamide N-methylase [Hyphomicrobiales bacterium]|nr:MAG: nicotinamide N-methylase [Hyphomicrobiales bacterium]